ncbi:elongation factor P--(R)-beta-lysine ligase [Pseudidiomarina gelatinasegens]|uniref:elongation factor P--(R)-beta-lysine ligase n=1 Tax=Pseudidiomarina gelatinasegens TaxID=2487740 RepID=UPI003A96D878
MQLSDDWRPSATLDVLKQRAALLQKIRQFFAKHDVLEVDTPILSRFGVSDLHLENLSCQLSNFPQRDFHLQTSPEYAMKRLLAAHGQSIYQLGKVFRDDAVGRHHNPEFTLLEWYRINFSMDQLITEVLELLVLVLGERPVMRLSYQQVFEQYLQINPLQASIIELQKCLSRYSHISDLVAREIDRDTLLQLAMSIVIEPLFDKKAITVVHSFPASQAALAELNESDVRVAYRFEVYAGGIELANGYQELTDAKQQQARFDQDNRLRSQHNKPQKPVDFRLVQALESGLPRCAGVALGFDRLFMLAENLDDIRQALPFSITCA